MPIVQCSCLGKKGRTGNQCMQAAVARAYAELTGSELQIPADWEGRKVFVGWDKFAPIGDRQIRADEKHFHPDKGVVNIDLDGYFQQQRFIDLLSRRKLKEWFTIKPEVAAKYLPAREPYCAMHLRHGDYEAFAHIYAIIEQESYLRAYDNFGCDLPIVWVRAEDGHDWLHDFLVMQRADVLFRANSTFSWWAAALSDGKVYSPLVAGKHGHVDVEFVAGNWPRCVDLPNVTDLHLPE